jgi:drug/metabolite transporter (DMT)-like permease
MTLPAAIVLAVVATTCFQAGLVLQKLAADRLPRLGLRARQGSVYLAFFRSPTWLAGMAINVFGWVLLLKALANAPVSIIQPVLGFGLALLALLSVVFLGERLSALEWTGVVTLVAGIVCLGVSGAGPAGETAPFALAPLFVVSLAFAIVLGAAVPLGRAGRVSMPVVLGFGSGVLVGLGALYAKGLFLCLEAGLSGVAWLVFLPLMLVVYTSGMWVMQAGFQQGRALIVVALNAVTNKVVAIVGGMATLGEVLPDASSLAAARLAGFVLVLVGTALLARIGAEAGRAAVEETPATV